MKFPIDFDEGGPVKAQFKPSAIGFEIVAVTHAFVIITLKVDETDLKSERVPVTVTEIDPTLAAPAVLQSNVLLLGVLNVTGVAGTAENE